MERCSAISHLNSFHLTLVINLLNCFEYDEAKLNFHLLNIQIILFTESAVYIYPVLTLSVSSTRDLRIHPLGEVWAIQDYFGQPWLR